MALKPLTTTTYRLRDMDVRIAVKALNHFASAGELHEALRSLIGNAEKVEEEPTFKVDPDYQPPWATATGKQIIEDIIEAKRKLEKPRRDDAQRAQWFREIGDQYSRVAENATDPQKKEANAAAAQKYYGFADAAERKTS